ncbi:ATPase WRNIP1 [Phasianus colchicus]|uniref:ATPase WRNIP1 n=1 Tax=Phasianus colchicus TaxID=9054 RepID=A0A669P9W5_PHACC|nr:ATPase WRNIP1 [Phasianus colchicus]
MFLRPGPRHLQDHLHPGLPTAARRRLSSDGRAARSSRSPRRRARSAENRQPSGRDGSEHSQTAVSTSSRRWGRTTAPEGLRAQRAGGLASRSGAAPTAPREPMEGAEARVSCPVCLRELPGALINAHLDRCLQAAEGEAQRGCSPPSKRPRLASAQSGGEAEERPEEARPAAAPVFSLFHKGRSSGPGRGDAAELPEEDGGPALRGASVARRLEGQPLADRLRPDTLRDYVGQERVLGANTLLRSLLESHEIPSIILWGPPGCGKTTLAHIIANSSKKKGMRFVTLSATSAKTNDVRDVISQAQNEKRLFKRKTILFIDEIHRFNKSQQDTFLPHVECGTVTLIGATTENPSFQVNAALLSRCRVIVLEKLSVEAMEAILLRAVKSLGVQVLGQGNQHSSSATGSSNESSELPVYIEEKALSTLAYLCDGDARTGLNGLQLAVQARLAAGKTTVLSFTKGCSVDGVLITEEHVKEGLQRSHILYDRAGEEHYNCISALHKSIRGSDENASLYWLARMLEGGEDPLYVARRLVRFASEDIGLADPLALTQAVAAYQGCHFIGMPECEVILAQCVVYFARAPKSIEVYRAYSNVKECLRMHTGPLPPVPLHLRNAPTRLMKDLGYGKGYKYNPMYKEPVEQDYLPEELKGTDFFKERKT